MVIDTSALLALLLGEEDVEALEAALATDAVRLVSAATLVEAAIVAQARLGEAGARELDALLRVLGAEIVPVDAEQAEEARSAWSRFGRGRHPAGLNFGDVFPYALSRVSGEPLLFRGRDFSRTDVTCALP